ncbi:MAG TPA: hypothetical protein VN814_23890 [Caulobacteraceae bacterium]|nr:hypothetical protein [Caulobacteraceae bacterium]
MTGPARLQAGKTTLPGAAAAVLAALAVVGLVGCGETSTPADNAVSAQATPTEDYRPAPELLGGAAGSDGRVQLYGSAVPGAAVRLRSPSGAQQFATADAAGMWRVTLAPSPQPRLLGLSMSDKGQVVQAVSFLFLAPDGAVARLKAGGGTQAAAPGKAGLAALALDYDNQRAATLSGVAAPHETVTVRVDGVERSQADADSGGRFVLPLPQLTTGAHEFDLMGAAQEVRFSASVDTPAALAQAPYAATRVGQGWRIDWRTPGGGGQTTLILGPQETGP